MHDNTQPLVFDLILSSNNDEKVANFIESDLEVTTEDKINTAKTIGNFIYSYKKKSPEQSNQDWLTQRFLKHANLWSSQQELVNDANAIVEQVEDFYRSKLQLEAYESQGGTREAWLANQIEQGAKRNGIENVAQYAQRIDDAINQGNSDMASLIYCKNGAVNQQYNLDGFIAENHHATSFNIDAKANGSNLRAEVLKPDSGYNKNSVDIVIKDENGKIVRRYQSKYGKDDKATGKLFEKGDYRGQRKLVPEGHSGGVENSTEFIEAEGIKSRPLTKEEAKEYQRQMQEEQIAREYTWSDANRTTIAKNIGKSAMLSSAMACGFHGGRIVGRRVWNFLTGDTNQSIEEDLAEFVQASLTSGASAGFTVAVTGGATVAVKSGWLGTAIKNTPVGRIASAVTVGIENLKVLNRYANGEMTAGEALDEAGRVTTATIGSIAGGAKGATIGATLGTVLGPIGTVIGGVAGGVVGSMLGGGVAETLYSAGKSVVSSAIDTVKSVASSIGSGISSMASTVGGWVNSWF